MYFKNIIAYKLTQELNLNDDKLQKQLKELESRPCGNQETATIGFSSPFALAGQHEMLFHKVDNRYWFVLKKHERILPSSVVNEELEAKIEHIEAETGSPVGKKARSDLKQEIITRLLPQAFVKSTYTHGFISLKDNLVVVDSSSHGKAETFLAMLRKALGSLPVVPLVRHTLQSELTHWLSKQTPSKISLLEEADFKSTDEQGSLIKVKNQPLDSEEVSIHLDSGKLVQRIAFEYDDTLTIALSEDGTFKKLKFTDRVIEECQDIPKDQVAARLDAEFVLISGEITNFLNYMTEQLNLDKDLE